VTRPLSGIAGALSLIALLLAAGYTGQGDYADALVMEQMRKEILERRLTPAERAERALRFQELLCGCPSLNGRVALRLAVVQQRDMGFCQAHCAYEDGSVTQGSL